MKVFLFIALMSLVWYPSGQTKKQVIVTIPSPPVVKQDITSFEKDIQPIFQKHCNPCHFPGGKMYERLPFDKAATILKPEVQPGILKRIRDEKENEMIRTFIRQNTKS